MVHLQFSFSTLFLSFIASTVGTSAPSPLSRRVLHDRRTSVPPGWSLHRRADPDIVVPFSIVLKQSNLDRLDEYLLDVADPDSPNYGKHWTSTQVVDVFRPSRHTVDTVHSWLTNDGVDTSRVVMSEDGGHINLNLTVAEAERLLTAEYYVYQHSESGTEHVGCHHGYHLPEHIVEHVDLVWPTIQFGGVALSAKLSKRAGVAKVFDGTMEEPGFAPKQFSQQLSEIHTDAEHCDTQITPECVRALYDFHYNFTVPEANSVAVVELAKNTYLSKDLDMYFRKFAPELVGTHPKFMGIKGGFLNQSETSRANIGESNLDFELIMPLLGKTQEVILYQVGTGFWESLLSALDATYCDPPSTTPRKDCGDKFRANVVSVSYADSEAYDLRYMLRTCAEFGKLSLMGTTFLFASGDNGVASNFYNHCLAPNGTLNDGHDGNFLPNFPATCPYVTSVGSTQLERGKKVSDGEVATLTFGSGGGFSNVFARPSWQDRAVGSYLKKHAPDYGQSVYNRTGRGIPDISANGYPIVVVDNEEFTTTFGTSASTPIIAAMITAVNDARIAAGKGPVGWINPALYSRLFASVWNDITKGSNGNCGSAGFSAVPGWDPVTGLGTPRFQKMLERFMMLP